MTDPQKLDPALKKWMDTDSYKELSYGDKIGVVGEYFDERYSGLDSLKRLPETEKAFARDSFITIHAGKTPDPSWGEVVKRSLVTGASDVNKGLFRTARDVTKALSKTGGPMGMFLPLAEQITGKKYTPEESPWIEKAYEAGMKWAETTAQTHDISRELAEKPWYSPKRIAGTGLRATPQIAGVIAGGVSGGPVGAAGMLGAIAYGSSAEEARAEGATDVQQVLHGLTSAEIEIITEAPVFAAVGKLWKQLKKSGIADDVASSFATRVLRGIGAYPGVAIKETLQEPAAYLGGQLSKKALYDEDAPITLKDAVQAAYGGFAMATTTFGLGLPAGIARARTGTTEQPIQKETPQETPVPQLDAIRADLRSGETSIDELRSVLTDPAIQEMGLVEGINAIIAEAEKEQSLAPSREKTIESLERMRQQLVTARLARAEKEDIAEREARVEASKRLAPGLTIEGKPETIGERGIIAPKETETERLVRGAAEGRYGLTKPKIPLTETIQNQLDETRRKLAKEKQALKQQLEREKTGRVGMQAGLLQQQLKRERAPVAPVEEEITTQKVERRKDIPERERVRKLIEEGRVEEVEDILYSDSLSGLKNKRGWDADERKPVQGMIDADGLKWFNDTLGYEAGDKLLKKIGDGIKSATDSGARVGGDEYRFEASNREEADRIADKILDFMESNPITIEMPDGEVLQYKGRLSYGIGESEQAAEKDLKADRTRREATGERTPRGAEPEQYKQPKGEAIPTKPVAGEERGAGGKDISGRSTVGEDVKEPSIAFSAKTRKEVESWIETKAKEYGGRNPFYTSEEYKQAYPTIKEIYDAEHKEFEAEEVTLEPQPEEEKNIPTKIIELTLDRSAANVPNITLDSEEFTGAMLIYGALRKHLSMHIETFAGKTRFSSKNSLTAITKIINKDVNFYIRKWSDKEERQGAIKAFNHLKTKYAEIIKPQPELGKIAVEIKTALNRVEAGRTQLPINSANLFKWANEEYGGKQSEGAYTPKDAYDQMELGVNQHILESSYYSPTVPEIDASLNVSRLKRIISYLPTQTKRTEEVDEFQQFSTPPSLSYAANWVANISEKDIYLEPSAGIGGLAIFGKKAGAKKVIVNELSQRRREILESLPFDEVHKENAEQINSLRHIFTDRPSVIVMNPPFSATAGRVKGKRSSKEGLKHIDQALELLLPNGRLVAIIGKGVNAPSLKKWRDESSSKYTVRANIGISGKEYSKYGTTFDNVILVIDKVAPSGEATITGNVDKIEELIPLLKEVRNERIPQGKQPSVEPGGEKGTSQGEGEVSPGRAVLPPTGRVGAEERGDRGKEQPIAGTTGGLARPEKTLSSHEPYGRPRGTQPDVRTGREEPKDTVRPGDSDIGTPGLDVDRGDIGLPKAKESTGELQVIAKKKEEKGEITEDLYADYTPEKITLPGAKKHPTPLVQSSAMAMVSTPTPTYKPSLPKKSIKSGQISEAQIEPVVYAGEAHSKILPNGERRGFYIGDGTGVGKGREIAAIIWDNWAKGRKKAVWVSENAGLIKDAKRDIKGIGWNPGNLFKPGKLGADIKNEQGILFTSYSTIASKSKLDATITRMEQLVKWVGEDFDGVIAFDESHNMANSLDIKGERGVKAAANKARSGVEIQRRLPNARIVYVSATGSTEVENLVYADRLGLWGEATPFPDKISFINEMKQGGIAAMELVAQNMKAMGSYVARSLSYDGVEYDSLETKLSKEQKTNYDTLAEAWQLVLANINAALKETGAVNEEGKAQGNAKKNALGQFWGAHQRFFSQVLTGMQLPALIKSIKKDIANGEAVVIQLTNTNEASQNKALERMTEDDSLDDFSTNPLETMMGYLENSFPVQAYHEERDMEGNTVFVPSTDSEGNAILDQRAVERRERLLDKIGSMVKSVGENPLDQIIDEFGPDAVAEVTGRGRRIVTKVTEKGQERVIEKWSKAKGFADAKQFAGDKKRILIFSEAGGTGVSYHADLDFENQRKRNHYILQPGWRADKAIQGMGRTHRSNQKQPPKYIFVTTDIKAQKRFVSTIARRLDQLGAMTKGQRQTGGQGVFNARDNLETDYARSALYQTFLRLTRTGNIGNVTLNEFERQIGQSISFSYGGLRPPKELPEMTRWLNRMLNMNVDSQNEIFNAFEITLDGIIADAAEAGTLDVGLETLTADKITKLSQEVIYEDKDTGAKAEYVKLSVENATVFLQYKEAKKYIGSFYRNIKSDKVWAGKKISRFNRNTGLHEDMYSLTSPTHTKQFKKIEDVVPEKWEKLLGEEPKKLWNKAIEDSPKTSVRDVHMVTGTLLPVWDRLVGFPRIVRVQTESGEQKIGRLLSSKDLAGTLTKLGVTAPEIKISPDELLHSILDQGARAELGNGWVLVRKRVAGEHRVELINLAYADFNNLQKYGVFSERINYETRFFVPTGQEGVKAIEAVLKNRPIISLSGQTGDVNQAKQRIIDALKDERGSFSLKRKEGPAIYEDLMVVAKDMIGKGTNTYSKFAVRMKKAFADLWDKIKNIMPKLFADAKKLLKDERGMVGKDIAPYEISDKMKAYIEAIPGYKETAKRLSEMEDKPSSPEGFNMPTEGKGRQVFDLLQWKLQDRLNSLKKVQKTIEKEEGVELSDEVNAYQVEEVYISKASTRIRDFERNHIDPLVEAIEDSGYDLEDVELFLYARHAPEANERLEKINPNVENNTALSGMPNSEAGTILKKYAKDSKMHAIGNSVDRITGLTRKILVAEGLAKAEEIDAWTKAYKHYIPLRREGKTPTMPKRGRGMDVGGPESKKRLTGSAQRRAVNILSNVIAQHEATLIRAEKAKPGRALLKLAEQYPNKEIWEVDAPELKPFLKQRKDVDPETGLPVSLNEVVFGKDILYKFQDNVLVVKIEGEEHTITFNDQNVHAQRIAKAFKNLGADSSSAVVNILSRVNRYLAIMNTSANLEFLISNFARDLQTAGYNINDTEAKGLKWKIFKSVPKALLGARHGVRGKYDTEWAKHYREYELAGGQTGWVEYYANIEKREKELRRKLEALKPGPFSATRRGVKAVFDFVSNENMAVENAIRLSVFTHLKDKIGVPKAASTAKNLTVNFNRKGDWGQALNAMYLFFGASIQGNARLFQAVTRSPVARRLVYGTVGFAVVLDMMNRAMGGEDDDGENRYDKIPTWIKEHNLIVMTPGGYVKVPLPWGYNVLHVTGQLIGEAIDPNYKSKFSPIEAAVRAGSAILGSFNPMGSESTILQVFSPTIFDPFVQWDQNKKFSGVPIKPEQMPFDVPKPEYQMYWQGVSEPSKWITKKLNDLTGGDEITPGLINLSPEIIDHLFSFALGGAGRFVDNTVSLPKTLSQKKIEVKRIPFLRRAFGQPTEYYTRTKYYDNLSEIRYAEKSIKHYKGKPEEEKIKERYKTEKGFINKARLTNRYIAKRNEFIKKYEANKRLSEEEITTKVENYEKQINDKMVEFNKQYGGRQQ